MRQSRRTDRRTTPAGPAVSPSATRISPWAWYLAAGLAGTVISLLVPAEHPARYAISLTLNVSVIGAFAWGLRRHRPSARAPRLALMAGYAFLLPANAIRYGNGGQPPILDDPLPAGLYLVAYLAILVGLALLVRARGAWRDRMSLADAAIIGTGISILWADIAALFGAPGVSGLEQIVATLYPAPDFLFLTLLLWIAFSRGPRGTALLLLFGGFAAQGVADALLGIAEVGGTSVARVASPLWLASMTLVGAAALHPSLSLIAARGEGPPLVPAGRRIYLLALVSLLGPFTFLRHAIDADDARGLIVAVSVAVLMLLVYARLRGLLVDIDTHARAHARITAAEATFRRLVELVPAVIYFDATDAMVADGSVIRYVSPRWEELTGHSAEATAGHYWLFVDHLHPEDRERVMAEFIAANDRGGATTVEYRVITADGRELWVRDETAVTARDADGRACAWHGVLVDITEARRADDEIRRLNASLEQRIAERTADLVVANLRLQQANAYLERIVSTVPVILYQARGAHVGIHSETEYNNTGAVTLLGFSAAEAMAPGFWVARVHPDDLPGASAAVLETRTHRQAAHAIDYRMIHRDGHTLWVRDVASYTYATDGSWTSAGVVIDVTEQRHAEDELRLAKALAETANRAKSEFLSSMSHELRTPLNAILGFGQLLEMSALPADDQDSVGHILRAGRSLLTMVEGVLDLAYVESGRLTLSLEAVRADEVVSGALDLVRPRASDRGIRLLPPAVGRHQAVLADRHRLRQVLVILLRNAVDYNRDEGSVTIASRVVAGERVRISVADTGLGIPPEREATLFTILDRRVGAGAANGSEGLGVGLALAARLVEAMGGSISVESAPGQGSTFSVELPMAVTPPAAPDAEPGAPASGPDLAEVRTTVVYVEDNLANLALVERILRVRPEMRVLAAMQASSGLDLIRRHHPDLVLLDHGLPDMYGEEVLRLLKADPATSDIPVIVLTSSPADGGQRWLGLGATACLAKPIDRDVLVAEVDHALREGFARA